MSNVIYEYKEETETLELNMEYKLLYSKKWRDFIWNTKSNSLNIQSNVFVDNICVNAKVFQVNGKRKVNQKAA